MATKDKDLELQKETQQSSGGTVFRPYQPSEAVKTAQSKLQSQLTTKPGAYQSPWQTQLNDTMNKILNREKFNYDLNGDALWQQYKDRYVQQGKMAMMDTMGQASALTGGYGNSYAQQVGQQTYQQYLTGLTDKIPELYQLALDKYQMEGNDLYNQYGILGDRENLDYGRYRDGVADWNAEYSRLYGEYADERGFDYGQHADQLAQDRWQAEFDENKRRYDQEWAEAHPELVGGVIDDGNPNPDDDPDDDNPDDDNPDPNPYVNPNAVKANNYNTLLKSLDQLVAAGATHDEILEVINDPDSGITNEAVRAALLAQYSDPSKYAYNRLTPGQKILASDRNYAYKPYY
jgi:hypothetical protein